MEIFKIITIAATFSGFVASDDMNEIRIGPNRDLVFEVGESMTLTCTAQTDDISNLRWIGPDNQEIVSGSNSKRDVKKSGERSLDLDVGNLTLSDGGDYRCSGLSALAEEPVSKSKRVVVYDPVKFVDAPTKQEFLIDETAEVVCNVGGTPDPVVLWFVDERMINTKVNDKYSRNGSNLEIHNVSKSDEKTYICRARQEDLGPAVERQISLIVNIEPVIEDFENIRTVVAGDSEEFTCGASGFPEPNYSWYNGDGTGGDAFLDYGNVLTLNISENMDRSYTCIAQNKVGSDRATLTLDIQVKPSFTVADGDETQEREPATLSCVADGIPTPTVHFYRNDILLSESSVPSEDLDAENATGSENSTFDNGSWSDNRIVEYSGNNATITFRSTDYTDNGKYECRAENEAGSNSTDVFLDLKYTPQLKSLSNKWACIGSSPQLNCEFHGNPSPNLTWGRYIPQEGSVDNENGTMAYVPIDASDPADGFMVEETGSILSLIIDTSIVEKPFGMYVCSAENSVGTNNATAKVSKAKIPLAPIGVQFSDVTTSEATISFDPLIPLVPYELFKVKLEPSSLDAQRVSKTLKPGDETEVRFTGLTHDTEYTIVVEAKNCAGWSEPNDAEHKTFTTVAIESPGPVEIISGETSIDHDKYTVEWKPGNIGGGNIKKILITLYEIKVDIDGDNRTEVDTFMIPGNLTKENGSFVITDLNPATQYEVAVEIYNEVGSAPTKRQFRTNIKTTTDAVTTDPPISTASSDTKLIIIIIVVVLVLILIIDITCCVTRRWGLSYWVYAHTCGKGKKHHIEDAEEGSAEYRDVTKLAPIDEQTPLQNDEGATGGQPAATENGTVEGPKEQEETAEKAEEKNGHSEQEKLVPNSTEPSA